MHRLLPLCALILGGYGSAIAIEAGPSPSGQIAEAWTLEQVIALLKEECETSMQFEEEIHSSLLTQPLIVRGVLRFLPPSTLEKEVLEPYRERYLIEGDRVTFESERKHVKKTISLEAYPALRNFVEAFRAGLAGDAERLQQTYETTLDGDRRAWTLLLRPQDPGRSMVEHILFAGSGGRIATITVRRADGDRSVMKLSTGSRP